MLSVAGFVVSNESEAFDLLLRLPTTAVTKAFNNYREKMVIFVSW